MDVNNIRSILLVSLNFSLNEKNKKIGANNEIKKTDNLKISISLKKGFKNLCSM